MRSDSSCFAAAALATALLAGGAALGNGDPFTGSRTIALGDTVNAEVTAAAGETHQFLFTAPAGTKVKASLAVTGGDLVPELRLTYPGGQVLDVGTKLNEKNPAAPKIGNFPVPRTGVYALQVRAASGSGTYSLRTGGKLGTKFSAAAVESGQLDAYFDGVAGGIIKNALVKPTKGSPALPEITGLADPEGFAVAILPGVKGVVASFKAVTLPKTGRYEILWRNNGDAGPCDVQVVLKNPKPVPATLDLGAATALPSTLVDTGDPVLAARAGYVGSTACSECHGEQFVGWAGTAHNNAVRTWNRAGLTGRAVVADADANGVDDFMDGGVTGNDLATLDTRMGTANLAPDWVAYGANAPRLIYRAGQARPYRILIGDKEFEVWRTMGGNGMFKQRFLTKINDSYYVLPIQYNESNKGRTGYKAYTVYNGTNWYDGSKVPLFTTATLEANVNRTKSFEANCSGCHNVGETIEVQPDGDFVTGYVEFNIGCEQCHGPGAAHVAAGGDRSLISNPRDLLDGTAGGVALADAVCGRCHTRGESKEAILGSTLKSEFPYNQASGVQQLGDDQAAFYETIFQLAPTNSTQAGKMWGFKAAPLPALPGDTFLTSKNHHQQHLDIGMGPHAPDKGYDATCFDCHDAHGRKNAHSVAVRVNRDGTTDVATRADDNSLCLSCHAGYGPFAALTKAEAAQIASGTTPVAVVDAVTDHMKDIGMPVATTAYDPTGTGVGKCVACHMVKSSASANSVKDKGGYYLGDVSTHTFLPIWPSASKKINTTPASSVTNSCNACHDPADLDDGAAAIIEQWAADGPDADGTYHADTPRSYQNAVANAESTGGGVACVACHTTKGFVDIQVKGEGPYRDLTSGSADETYRNTTLKESIRRYKGIACDACHGAQTDGTFAAGTNPLRFPKADLCGKCHNNETVVFGDFDAHGEMVRHPQREMLAGSAGAEVSGTYGNTYHTVGVTDGCVACHFDAGNGGNHRFEPVLATCNAAACHGGSLTGFNRAALGDFDGLNGTQGIQDEVTGLLDLVKNAILAQPNMTFASNYFDYGGATDHKLTGAPAAVKRAAFNWYSVTFDASKGIHNAKRAVQLLQRSYKEVTGVDVPGASLR